jgi:hypothetical protein
MPGSPEECRAHARQCAAMAERADQPRASQDAHDLANTWLRLAADLEAHQTLIEAYPPELDGMYKDGNGRSKPVP